VSEDIEVIYSLTVRVVDLKGEEIEGAEVRVKDTIEGHLVAIMTTKTDGMARTLLAEGTYELEIRKDEITLSRVIELRSDKTVRVVLELGEDAEVEETPVTMISAMIAVVGSLLYLAYRRYSSV